MPLTELLRMSKGKVDANQQRDSSSTDPSCRPDSDCVELVWENGQIMMQGQSSKARKGHIPNFVQPLVPKPQDGRNANGSKMAKFSSVDSVLADFSLPVPSSEMGLDQDVDMVTWLNYPIEDHLHNDYASEFLPELSGVTINDLSSENPLESREKKTSFHGNGHTSVVANSGSLKHGNTSKVSSSTEKHTSRGSSDVPQFPLLFQHKAPRSGISNANITGNDPGNAHHVASRESIHNPTSLCAFTNLRLQKLDAGQPSTSSGITNFSYFSRPAVLARANHQTMNNSKRSEHDDRRCTLSNSNPADSTLVNVSSVCSQKEMVSRNQSVVGRVDGNLDARPTKPAEEVHSTNQAIFQEDVAKNDGSQNQAYGATMTKEGTSGEKNKEPVGATSSACSGNSVERASNELARKLKRKSHETGESEGPSEEVEEESVGARKVTPSRTGSKRSRAAEVHNLSERRRRDRINEKMRALQELIPNCNKVDKASMLDEAIEYLKTLQLQVQMLSLGAGLYMQPMMLPPGPMQPIHGAHMPPFSPMRVGMGISMGLGMNMLDVNNGIKMMPFQGQHYPVGSAGPAFNGLPSSGLPAFGHPGQGLPVFMQQAPVLPLSGGHPPRIPTRLNVPCVAGSCIPHLAPSSSSKEVGPQATSNPNFNGPMNQASNQATSEGIQRPPLPHEQTQPVNATEAPVASTGTSTMPS